MFHFAKYLYYIHKTEKHMCFTKKSTRKVVNAGYCLWCSYNLRHFNCSIKLMKTLSNSGLQITWNRAVSISYIFWNGPILEGQMQFYNLYGPIVSHRKREIGEREIFLGSLCHYWGQRTRALKQKKAGRKNVLNASLSK